jgi:hypothetical protein
LTYKWLQSVLYIIEIIIKNQLRFTENMLYFDNTCFYNHILKGYGPKTMSTLHVHSWVLTHKQLKDVLHINGIVSKNCTHYF